MHYVREEDWNLNINFEQEFESYHKLINNKRPRPKLKNEHNPKIKKIYRKERTNSSSTIINKNNYSSSNSSVYGQSDYYDDEENLVDFFNFHQNQLKKNKSDIEE